MNSRIARDAAVALAGVLLLAGCGNPALTRNDVLARSVAAEALPADLPQQAAANVRVYRKAPQRDYVVLASRDSHFDHQRLSVAYKEIELKKHLTELRRWAGDLGATAVIVDLADRKHDLGGIGQTHFGDGVVHTVLQTSDQTRVFVRSWAIGFP